MIYLKICATGVCRKVERPVWIVMGRNGPVITPHRHRALGVGDGAQIWSLGNLKGFPEARCITQAEYLQWKQEEGK